MTKISGRQNKRMEELTEEEKKALRGSKFAPLPAASDTAVAASNAVDGYDVFSAGNVELVDTHRRRGRPHKKTKPPSDPKALIVSSPTRIHVEVPNGPSSLVNDTVSAVARVVPAMDAVVKVFCVHTEPNFSLPWQRKRQYSSSSSGFMIKGGRVLTNAHSVEHYTQVKLKKRGYDTKYVATVLAIGTECDIAMLTVEDDEFWQGVSPVEFGNLPALQDAVTVDRYVIAWSVMIGCYLQHDQPDVALHLFRQMVCDHKTEVDGQVVVTVLKACTQLGNIRIGNLIHAFVIRRGLGDDVFVGNSLVDFYSKCDG